MKSNSILLTVLRNRNFWLALFITVTASVGNVLVRQPVNLLSDEVGLGVSVFGFVSSIYVVFSILGSGPFSNAVEHARHKTWILGGQYAVRGLVFIGFGLCASAPLYIFLRFMQGLTFGMGHIAMMIVIAETMDKKALGSAFGLIVLFTKLLSSLTNSLTLWITTTFGIEYSCFAGAIFSFIPGVLCLFLVFPHTNEAAETTPKRRRVVRLSTFINIRSVPILLIMMLICIPSLFIDNFMILYGQSSNMVDQAGTYLTSYMWWMGVGSFVAGYAYDRFGFKGIAMGLAVVCCVAQLMLGFSVDMVVWMISSVLCGIAAGGISAVTRAFIVTKCPSSLVALTVASLGIMQDVSSLLGMSVGGVLADSLGYLVTFRIIAICPIVSFLLIAFCLPRFVAVLQGGKGAIAKTSEGRREEPERR